MLPLNNIVEFIYSLNKICWLRNFYTLIFKQYDCINKLLYQSLKGDAIKQEVGCQPSPELRAITWAQEKQTPDGRLSNNRRLIIKQSTVNELCRAHGGFARHICILMN